jgi:hypothetical protein
MNNKAACSTTNPSILSLALPLILLFSLPARATDEISVNFITGNLWLLIATAMVFMIHLSWAGLERASWALHGFLGDLIAVDDLNTAA